MENISEKACSLDSVMVMLIMFESDFQLNLIEKFLRQ